MKVLVRDSRTCFCCGAIYGRCEHTHGKVDEYYIDAQQGHGRAWKNSDLAALIAARREGLSYTDIAKLLNRPASTVQRKGQGLGL